MDDERLKAITRILSIVTMVVAIFKYAKRDRWIGRDWEGAITRNRDTIGAYKMVVPRLIDDSMEDDEDGLPCNRLGTFRNYFRLSKPQFKNLLDRVTPYISREDASMRLSISAEQRLMVSDIFVVFL